MPDCWICEPCEECPYPVCAEEEVAERIRREEAEEKSREAQLEFEL